MASSFAHRKPITDAQSGMHILQGGLNDVSDALVVSHLGLFIGLRRKVGVMVALGFVAYRDDV